MKFTTNKEKGNSGIGIALAYFATQGYVVSLPLNDTQDYDLVFDNGKLNRVQVKATGTRSPNGHSLVSLKSCGGSSRLVYKTVIETDIEYLFVVNEKMMMWLIPIEALTQIQSVRLNENYDKYIVKM